MILIAGLSPAWQQVLVLDGVRSGEVNRARDAYWCGSGKVLNAAVCARQLSGGDAAGVRVLSTLGGPAFEPVRSEFIELGIESSWIRTAAPTRVCTTVLDSSTGTATELIENAAPITDMELEAFEEAFADAVLDVDAVLLIGSLPKGAPADFFRRLLRHAKCPAVLDLRGPELLAALEAGPAVVKPNREEIGHTLGRSVANDQELDEAIAKLIRRGANAVVVSAGSGDVCVATSGETRRIKPPAVERVVNPIGCGDCMAAGITLGVSRGLDLIAAVELGLNAAARNLKTLLPGDLDGSREQQARR